MDLSKVKEKTAGFLNGLKEAFANLRPGVFSLGRGQRGNARQAGDQGSETQQPNGLKVKLQAGLPAQWKILSALSGVTGKIKALTDRFLAQFPEGKRRPILFGIRALVAVFFILVIVALVNPGSSKKDSSAAAGPGIPSDELFLPAEPDFLPEFLSERRPRSFWSVEDISPYWRNPVNTGLWQGVIKSEVDKLMEGVP